MGVQSLGDRVFEARQQDAVRSQWLLEAARIADEMHQGDHSAGQVADALRRSAADRYWRDR